LAESEFESELNERRARAIAEDVIRYVGQYRRVSGKATPLRLVASRYGKMFKGVGLMLTQGLALNPRLDVRMTESGASTVSLRSLGPLDEFILDAIEGAGGAMSGEALKEAIRGADFVCSAMDYMNSIELLFKTKLIGPRNGLLARTEVERF